MSMAPLHSNIKLVTKWTNETDTDSVTLRNENGDFPHFLLSGP